MILVDTSIWIDFFKAHPETLSILQSEIELQNVAAAEPVFGELLQGTKNTRERNMILEYWKSLPKRSESGLWLKAGILASQNQWFAKGVGLIDAFLIAYAREYNAKVWTLDKKLKSVLNPAEIYQQAPGT